MPERMLQALPLSPLSGNPLVSVLMPVYNYDRYLARAVGSVAAEGQPQLAKLEALLAAIRAAAGRRFRQTLAGAMISASDDLIVIGRAPPRRSRP